MALVVVVRNMKHGNVRIIRCWNAAESVVNCFMNMKLFTFCCLVGTIPDQLATCKRYSDPFALEQDLGLSRVVTIL